MSGIIRIINSNSPLSRNYVHNPALYLGTRLNGERITTPSLIHSYWYLYLLHYETAEAPPTGIPLSRRFLNDESLRKNPDCIPGWFQRLYIEPTVEWTASSQCVYRNIIMQLIAKNSSFRDQFLSTLSDESPVSYQCPGSNRIYCTGTTERQLTDGHSSPGMNAWGQIYSEVAALTQKGFNYAKMDKFGEPSFSILQNPRLLQPNPSRTVLLIIDSYGKYLESIDNGDVVRVGGGTFQMLADEVVRQNVVLSDYKFIIVMGGLNEKKNDMSQQAASWNALKRLIAPEVLRRQEDADASSILFCLTPPVASERSWLSEQHYPRMREVLDGDGVSIIDWNEQSCPFVDAKGLQEYDLFDRDGIHLNHCGFRQLWRSWCQPLLGLIFVGFKMESSTEQYQSEKKAQKRRQYEPTGGSKWSKQRRVQL